MKHIIHFCLLIVFISALPFAQAGSKEKEELQRLQNDVLALQNQIREFEKSFNERFDALKSLVVQLNDQVAKSSLILGTIKPAIESQASGANAANQNILKEIRNLSVKIDDTSTRMSILAQQMSELKVQSKPLAQEMAQGGSSQDAKSFSAENAFNQASVDLVQGNLDLAIQGFTAYLNILPGGDKALAAQCNIGEAYYYQKNWQQAIIAFSRVIENFPGTDKIPSALFKRALSEIMLREKENAIADFKDLIQKFPTASESIQAKEELKKLGIGAAKPVKNPPRKQR